MIAIYLSNNKHEFSESLSADNLGLYDGNSEADPVFHPHLEIERIIFQVSFTFLYKFLMSLAK